MKRSLLFLFLFATAVGCKDKTETPITPVAKIDFTVSKTEVFPLEALTLTLAEVSTSTVIKGKIGPVDFDAKQVDGKVYALLVPATIKEGTYEFSITDGKSPVSLKVKAAKAISSADDYAETYFADVKNIIDTRLKSMQDSLIATKVSTQQNVTLERTLLAANLKSTSDKFNALSAENKMKCVAFIEANKSAFDKAATAFANINYQITPNPGGRIFSICNEATNLDNIKCQITNFSDGISGIQTALQALSTVTKFGDEPFVASAVDILANVVGLETMIEAKNVSKKLTRLTYVLTDPTLELTETDATTPDFNFNNEAAKTYKLGIKVRNIQESLDLNSSVPLNKTFATNFKAFIEIWNATAGNVLADKPDFAPLSEETISPEVVKDIAVTLANNPDITPVFSYDKNLLSLAFKTTQTKDESFDFRITYPYDGAETSVTKTAKLAPPISMAGTTWDFYIVYSATVSWHANVLFKADGTTVYDEPESPGVFTSYGGWTLTGDKIHWYLDKARETDWRFDGTITGNTAAGTFGPAKRSWTATKL